MATRPYGQRHEETTDHPQKPQGGQLRGRLGVRLDNQVVNARDKTDADAREPKRVPEKPGAGVGATPGRQPVIAMRMLMMRRAGTGR